MDIPLLGLELPSRTEAAAVTSRTHLLDER